LAQVQKNKVRTPDKTINNLLKKTPLGYQKTQPRRYGLEKQKD
jgi:hypothetical protein